MTIAIVNASLFGRYISHDNSNRQYTPYLRDILAINHLTGFLRTKNTLKKAYIHLQKPFKRLLQMANPYVATVL